MVAVAVGCSNGWYHAVPHAPTGLTPEDAITVILDQLPEEEYSARLEKKVARCIRNALEDTYPTVRMISPDEFRQAAFPDLTPEEIPPGGWTWDQLAKDPTFRERIAPLGLRYLIAVSVSERKTPKETKFGIDLYVWGVAWNWERWASMEADVVDFMNARLAGKVLATATGKSAFGVVFFYYIFPIPVGKPSFPKGRACRELGEGVAKVLTGEKPPDETEVEQFNEGTAKGEEMGSTEVPLRCGT